MSAKPVTNVFGRVVLLGLVASASCAPADWARGFQTGMPVNRAEDVAAISSTIQQRRTDPLAPYVVLVPPAPARGLQAFSLPSGQALWRKEHAISTRPIAAGNVVVVQSEGSVLGLDANNGETRWQHNLHGLSLQGAGGDDSLLALSIGGGSLNRRQGRFVVVDTRAGSVRFEREIDQALGVPTAAAGYAFVPWSSQFLSVFDVGRGEEVARIRSGDDLFSRVWREGNVVYFGARAIYRLGRAAASGERSQSEAFEAPRSDLPGAPTLLSDGYAMQRSGLNARERVTLVSRPDPEQPGVRVAGGVVYALFHRVIFAVEAEGGNVRWAHTLPNDLAGAQATRAGLLVVDDHGEASLLDVRAGNRRWHHALGAPAVQAIVQIPLDFSPPETGAEAPATPASTLLEAAGGTDARMVPARLFAINALARVSGEEATRGLLDLASRRNDPRELTNAAGEALSRRTEGVGALLSALERHGDYVRGINPPPVGPIARALVAARERRGAVALLPHLLDPETAYRDLPAVAEAVKELGDASAVPTLLDFLRMYHADEGTVTPPGATEPVHERTPEEQESLNAAVGTAAEAIAALGGGTERRWLVALYADANTLTNLRPILGRAAGLVAAPATTTADGGTGTTAPAAATPPHRLTQAMISDAFVLVREQMLQCLRGIPSRPSQVRITFRYDSAGTISTVSVTPTSLSECLSPMVLGVRLPESQVGREIGTYYLLGAPL